MYIHLNIPSQKGIVQQKEKQPEESSLYNHLERKSLYPQLFYLVISTHSIHEIMPAYQEKHWL